MRATFLASGLLAACASTSASMPSLRQVEEMPDAWVGKRVRLDGVLSFEGLLMPTEDPNVNKRATLSSGAGCEADPPASDCNSVRIELARPMACPEDGCPLAGRRVAVTGVVQLQTLNMPHFYGTKVPVIAEAMIEPLGVQP